MLTFLSRTTDYYINSADTACVRQAPRAVTSTALQSLSSMPTALRENTSKNTPGSPAGPMQLAEEDLPIGLRPHVPEKV